MNVGIIGGADGPTAVYVTASVGQQVLLHLTILAVILALALYMARKRKQHRFFAVLAAVWVVIVDRYVKRIVAANLAPGETAELLPGLFRLQRVHNYGAAWSSFSGMRALLVGVTSVAMLLLFWLLLRVVRHPLGLWSVSLIIGGGVGNLIDRLSAGYVVDMFACEFVNFPVFNVADVFVTCGAAAAAIYYWKYYEKYDAKESKHDAPDGGGT